MKRKTKSKIVAWVLALVAAVAVIAGGISAAFGAAGDTPHHTKTLTDNHDGTYTLALDVTGDADYDADPVKANVVIVLDTSGSMDYGTSYTPSNTGGYGIVDGEYVFLYSRSGYQYNRIGSGSYSGTVYYIDNGSAHQYNGTRYTTSKTRMAAAQESVNNLVDTLIGQNTPANPDTIEISLVTFSSDATYNTPGSATANNWASGTDATTLKNRVNATSANGGTNWDQALNYTRNLAAAKAAQQPDEKVYIVFFSDGEPTYHQGTASSADSHSHSNTRNGNGSDTTPADYYAAYNEALQINNASYDSALYGIFAFGTEESYMKNVVSYGNYGNASQADSVAGSLYFNANSPEDIEAAFEAIADSIVEAVGIADVSVNDGTTNQVQTSTETVELLEVDDSTFEYWLTWNLSAGTNTFKSFIGGEEVECTATANGNNVVVAWDGGTATYEGTITGSVVRVKWTEKTDFYNYDPPAATFNESTGAVDWDLDSLGTLLNGVTYTVTFDCYPSQTTYDTIAKLKNGDLTYADLDPEIQKYIVDNGGGSYSLRTNTSATLSYDDTRDDAGQLSVDYTNPNPVATDASTLTVNKRWEGAEADVDSVEMTVLMDGEEFHVVTLTETGGWSASSFISVGIIKNGEVLTGAEGHDFSFAELDDTQYHWELDSPTVHPMLVNGTLTMLVKADAAHAAPSGAQTYTINGATYYVDSSTAGLTATNYRRSNLNLTKVVTGEDAPEDATFPFTLTVNNPKAPATESADDTDHNSDYWVWFSIYDTNASATVTDATVTGATGPSADGYYYAPSGSAITVQMKDGWNLRFINLPTGTTYTFAEGTMPEGFAFGSAELTTGTDTTFSGAQTTTGTIQNTGTSYAVTYTNDYQLTNLEITKVWNDASNQDGKRPDADAFAELLTLSPAVEGANPTVTDNGDNTYTITYTGLPRFNNGTEVAYTVAEGTIAGYTTTGSPASDHGTITNTHTPEKTSVKVTKVWNDNNDEAGLRPQSITVKLLANGAAPTQEGVTAEQALTGESWTYTWAGLDKYADGELIEYSVDEVAVDGYATAVGELTGDADSGYEVTITNSNATIPTDTETFFKKTVTAANPIKDATFSFTIAADSPADAPMPENTSGTAAYAAGETGSKTIDFGSITYAEAGTYTYTITEAAPADGWTAAGNPATVTVTVTGNATDGFEAEVTGGTIENAYSVKPTTVSFPVEKELVVPEDLEGPEDASWTVTLTAEDGSPTPGTTAGTITADEGVTFGEISYTEPGEYIYTITETGEVAGVTNDSAASTGKTVTVTVVDNGDGTLTATASATDNAPLTFTNLYAASGQIELEATKVAEGFDLTADQFSFELKNADGEVLQTKTNAADGKVAFDAIPYTAAGTYTYTISEVVVEGDDIADDTHVCNVTVTVVDNGDGTLTATAEYDNNIFTNKHTDTEKDVVSAKDTQISVDGELVEAGDVLTYTITYANNTAGEATVTVTDTIPTNTTYVEGSASDGGVYADGVITWTIEGVAAGASGSVTFQVTVDEAAAGTTIENTGNVDDGENKSSSNSVTTSVPVKDVKDESGASVDGEGVQVGDTLTYEVNFTLTEDTTSVVVTDDVPANTTLVEGSVSNGGTVSGGTITWDLGALAAGDHTVSFQVTVDESAATVDAITNTASISVNNHSEVKTNTVTNTPEVGGLTVSKTISVPEGYEVDEDAEFTFTVELADKNGKALEGEYAYTGDSEGTLTNGSTITLKHGESITIAGLPAGARYTVTEASVAGYTAESAVLEGTVSAGETSAATAAFVNAYNTEPAKVKLEVKKAITGAAWPEGKMLTFTLAAQGDAPMPEDATATLAAAGTATFDEIAFVRPGTYTYTITEDGFGAGWTGSPEQITATVTVTDNKNGTLTATTAYSPKDDLITNTYKATGSVELEAKKVLEGREWKDGETFTFTLYGSDGNVIQTIDVDGNKTVSFDAIKYDESDAGKTYTYTISETSALPGGVTKTGDITATVEVTDNGDGTLATKATYTNDDTITNTYTAEPVKAQVSVAKQIDGYIEGEDIYGKVVDRTFTVTMEGPKIDGKLTTTIATQGGTGTSTFDEIEYTFDDMVDDNGNRVTTKDFTYTVTETAGSDAGYTYDSNSYEVVVTVTDNQNGKLEITNITKLGDETNVKVVNEFQQESTEVTLTAHKTIEDQSSSAKDATFTFVLTPLDGAPGETQTKTVTTEGFKGSVDFDAIEFTKAGTYRYAIVETGEAPDGWTYDKTEYTVTIVANDNFETAILENKPTINGASTTEVTFNNVYKAAATDATLQVTKEVDDRSGSAGDVSFEFALATTNGAPMPATTTATAKAGETAEFGPITYEKAGTYNYTITETKGGDTTAGWTNDTTSYPVVVTVTDVDAKLVASVAYGESETDLTVTNIYDPKDAAATPKARKVVDDQSNSAPDEEFTFVLTPVDGAPGEAQAKTRLNGGPVEFDELTFERVGTYTYTIQEEAGSTNGFTYDDAAHTVTITVTDPGDGQLVASIEYADATDGELVITNPYCAEPTSLVLDVNKEITGLVGTEKDATFTFQLSGEGETLTATVTGAGTTSFDEITFTKAGTYTYTVTEINDGQTGYTYDGTVYTVTVEVVDEAGQLVATPTIEADGAETEGITFVNPYKPLATNASLVANKELTGRGLEAGEFSFQLTDAEGNVVATVTNDADGYVDFGSFAFDEAGTYTFTAVELAGSDKNIAYDSSIKTFTVEVVDVDGQLVATVTCDDASATFKNVYKTNPPKKRVIPPVIKKLLPMTGDPMAAGNVIGLTAMGTASLLTGLRLRRKNKRK